MADKETYAEVKNLTVKFTDVGDFVKGTLIEVNPMTKLGMNGKPSTMYRVLAKEGEFRGTTKDEKTGKFTPDKERTTVEEGEEYVFFASGVAMQQMKRVRIGQNFMIKFAETKPTDKGNDAKIIKVFPAVDEHNKPFMNEAWMKEQEGPTYGEPTETGQVF